MRRVYVLCLLTLIVVVMDILLFHTGAAARAQQPQQQSGFRVDQVQFNRNLSTGTAPVFGRIVGFDCVAGESGYIHCFVASSTN
jgi:hypothetical protein